MSDASVIILLAVVLVVVVVGFLGLAALLLGHKIKTNIGIRPDRIDAGIETSRSIDRPDRD